MSRASTTSLSMNGGLKGSDAGMSAGVSLDVKQVNNASHKKYYAPTASGAELCGQDGNPTSTEKVMGN